MTSFEKKHGAYKKFNLRRRNCRISCRTAFGGTGGGGREFLLIEKNQYYGGLCSSFRIDGFTFDYFIHMSFTKNDLVRHYFDVIPYFAHRPNPYNYYHGIWIKHPAINNLFPLDDTTKSEVLKSLNEREKYRDVHMENYENWLRYQFGDYFAEHFPIVYTRKYWAEEACNMETQWIGNRVYQPEMQEIITGMNTDETPVTYYAKEMRYPKNGGYFEFLRNFSNAENIRLNETVLSIDPIKKIVNTDKCAYSYEKLYSSVPIPELKNILADDTLALSDFVKAAQGLHWTSGYIISLGMKGILNRNDLWDYIYDEDIIVSRCYSPSLMSASTCPIGCCSIQAEIYTKDGKHYNRADRANMLEQVIDQLYNAGIIDKNQIVVKDIRFEKYCNVLFDKEIYRNRDIAIKTLKSNNVIPIGRFGRWEYLWSDQAFLSGYNAPNNSRVLPPEYN